MAYAAVLKTDKTPQLLNGGGDMGSNPVQSTRCSRQRHLTVVFRIHTAKNEDG